jgi:hypothetical protein
MTDDEMAAALVAKRLELQCLIDRAREENGLEVHIEWDGEGVIDIEVTKRWES